MTARHKVNAVFSIILSQKVSLVRYCLKYSYPHHHRARSIYKVNRHVFTNIIHCREEGLDGATETGKLNILTGLNLSISEYTNEYKSFTSKSDPFSLVVLVEVRVGFVQLVLGDDYRQQERTRRSLLEGEVYRLLLCSIGIVHPINNIPLISSSMIAIHSLQAASKRLITSQSKEVFYPYL